MPAEAGPEADFLFCYPLKSPVWNMFWMSFFLLGKKGTSVNKMWLTEGSRFENSHGGRNSKPTEWRNSHLSEEGLTHIKLEVGGRVGGRESEYGPLFRYLEQSLSQNWDLCLVMYQCSQWKENTIKRNLLQWSMEKVIDSFPYVSEEGPLVVLWLVCHKWQFRYHFYF